MITLIGTSTTTVGFGLCGIHNIYEVCRRTPTKDILQIIHKSTDDVIMIDEAIYNRIRGELQDIEKVIIKIPARFEDEAGKDEIEELVSDTLGMSV